MSNPSLDDVFRLDQLLHQLASYEVTGGKIAVPSSFEEAFELNKKTAEKFNYFKNLIQKGECTIDFIKERVLRKNGPFPKEIHAAIDNPDLMEKILGWQKEEEDSKEDKPQDVDFVKSLIKLFSDDMSESERETFLNKTGLKSFKISVPLPKHLPPAQDPSKHPEGSKAKSRKRKSSKPPKKQ